MKLIVGLGNPGKKYEGTRHNIGRMAVPQYAKLAFLKCQFKGEKKFQAQMAEEKIKEHKVLLALPETYMNNSGRSVLALKQFYKIKMENILIVFDEIQLAFGKLRLKEQGSSGGHNGMRSIIDSLGTTNIPRLRIGIKPESQLKIPLEKFVLKKFNKKEQKKLPEIFSAANSAISEWACR